jgi:Spy/CpxP family protein refolding chaperone
MSFSCASQLILIARPYDERVQSSRPLGDRHIIVKTVKPLLIAALCALSLGAPAFALAQGAAISDSTQPATPSGQPTSGPYRHHHHGMFSMLHTLDLSQQQQDQIKTLFNTYRQAHPEGSQPDPAARKQLRDQILAVLTPAQRTKLEQEKQAWHKQHPSPAPSSSPRG